MFTIQVKILSLISIIVPAILRSARRNRFTFFFDRPDRFASEEDGLESLKQIGFPMMIPRSPDSFDKLVICAEQPCLLFTEFILNQFPESLDRLGRIFSLSSV